MTVSTLTLTPDTSDMVPGAEASAEPNTTAQLVDGLVLDDPAADPLPSSAAATALARAARGTAADYARWLHHVSAAAACTHPVRLRGQLHSVDTTTGEMTPAGSTVDMPDGVIYKACGNRRGTVCPACAETYRADTYQLILAGLTGGKGVPATVATHPAAFPTLTAPSFGLVHGLRPDPTGRHRPCRPRRAPEMCPHGVALACHRVHQPGERILGTPLCLDCYDHAHQVVWNVMAGELWRRTTENIKATLRGFGRDLGEPVRLSFAKVAEMQARGVAHFHALIRLDGHNPADPAAILLPGPGLGFDVLHYAIEKAVRETSFRTLPHPDNLDGWHIGWGRELKILPVRIRADGQITETAVAGYLAKYATKATEDTGHSSRRLTPDTVDLHADPGTHTGRLVEACWHLGRPGSDLDPAQATANSGRHSYRRLRRWAHMLGFGGHFSTKSRAYSTTLRTLRGARQTWRRTRHERADHLDETTEDTTLVVGLLTYAGTGWRTAGDALLANTAAAKAREHRRTVKDQLTANRP